jgi:lysyl-tRNA synthetase class 2
LIKIIHMQNLSEQEQFRRQSLQSIRDLGIDPYPAALFPVNAYAKDIKNDFEQSPEKYQEVCLAGRLMSRRVMGKASFAELKDTTGRIQIYISRDEICPTENKDMYNTVFKKLLDIGDFIGVKGYVFKTQVGEISVHVTELILLAKALRPLPIVKKDEEGNIYDAFNDPEKRFRMRYVDLVVNEEVKETFLKRTKMIHAIRDFLNERGALEVDTPVLQSIAGGAAAKPFMTHHNALDIPLYLRIANELF